MKLAPNDVFDALHSLVKLLCSLNFKVMLQSSVLYSGVPCPEAELVLLMAGFACEVLY